MIKDQLEVVKLGINKLGLDELDKEELALDQMALNLCNHHPSFTQIPKFVAINLMLFFN